MRLATIGAVRSGAQTPAVDRGATHDEGRAESGRLFDESAE
jgi:hypothetical protein